MKTLKRVFFTACFIIIGSFLFGLEAVASELEVKVEPQVQEDLIGIQSTNYIKEGNATIYRANYSTVGARCDTSSYSNVQQITCTTYLDVKNKSTGKWTYTGQNTRFVNRYSSKVSGSVRYGVVRGYDYRIRTLHTVSQSGTLERLNAVTGSLKY